MWHEKEARLYEQSHKQYDDNYKNNVISIFILIVFRTPWCVFYLFIIFIIPYFFIYLKNLVISWPFVIWYINITSISARLVTLISSFSSVKVFIYTLFTVSMPTSKYYWRTSSSIIRIEAKWAFSYCAFYKLARFFI